MCDRVLCYMFFLYNMNEAMKHSSLFFWLNTFSARLVFIHTVITKVSQQNPARRRCAAAARGHSARVSKPLTTRTMCVSYPMDACMHLQAAPACARSVAQPPSRYRRRDRRRRMDALSARHGRLPVPEHVRTYLQLQGPAAAGDRIG